MVRCQGDHGIAVMAHAHAANEAVLPMPELASARVRCFTNGWHEACLGLR